MEPDGSTAALTQDAVPGTSGAGYHHAHDSGRYGATRRHAGRKDELPGRGGRLEHQIMPQQVRSQKPEDIGLQSQDGLQDRLAVSIGDHKSRRGPSYNRFHSHQPPVENPSGSGRGRGRGSRGRANQHVSNFMGETSHYQQRSAYHPVQVEAAHFSDYQQPNHEQSHPPPGFEVFGQDGRPSNEHTEPSYQGRRNGNLAGRGRGRGRQPRILEGFVGEQQNIGQFHPEQHLEARGEPSGFHHDRAGSARGRQQHRGAYPVDENLQRHHRGRGAGTRSSGNQDISQQLLQSPEEQGSSYRIAQSASGARAGGLDRHMRHHEEQLRRAANKQGQSMSDPLAPPSDPLAPPLTKQPTQDVVQERVTCIVCCEVPQAVAIGKCEHHQVCETCSLRMRLCYHDVRCPLCKTANDEVVILRWPMPVGSTFASLMQRKDQLWTKPKWAKGVYVDNDRSLQQRPLSTELMQRTSQCCPVCDKRGQRAFTNDKQLLQHMAAQHQCTLCHVCLKAHRKFVRELDPLDDAALAAHLADAHPACEFCSTHFYDVDGLYQHMNQMHFTCHVCQRAGFQHLYFRDAPHLAEHMAESHYVCTEPGCAEGFVAFASEADLRQHYRERHSAHMPRWDPSRARTMMMMSVGGVGSARGEPRRGGRNPHAAHPGRPTPAASRTQASPPAPARTGEEDFPALSGRRWEDAFPALQETQQPPTQGGTGAPPQEEESGSGLRVIDDDLGLLFSSNPGSVWNRQAAPGSSPPDTFPSLPGTAGRVAVPAPARGSWSSPNPQRPTTTAAMRLVKGTATCPCGRKVQHVAVKEGEVAEPLRCDRECEKQQRVRQLADAFGVEDPQHHASYWERHRNVNWPPHLLLFAHQQPVLVAALEQEFGQFVSDKAQKRHNLKPMTEAVRKHVHGFAEQYGLVTYSVGAEPMRYIQLYKSPTAGVPQRLLSEVASATSPEEAAKLVAAVPRYTLQLVDIAPGANLSHYLRSWAGDYTLTWQGTSSATLVFPSESIYKACSDALAGGIRGAFRVQRTKPSEGAAVPAARSTTAGATTMENGWLIVGKARAKVAQTAQPGANTGSAAASAGAGAASSADPWDSDDESSRNTDGRPQPGHTSPARVVDDWEAGAAGGDVVVPRGPALQLEESNMWQSLGEVQ